MVGPGRPVVLATRITANIPKKMGAPPSAVTMTAAAGTMVPATNAHSGTGTAASRSAQGRSARTRSPTVRGAWLWRARVTTAVPSAASARP